MGAVAVLAAVILTILLIHSLGGRERHKER